MKIETLIKVADHGYPEGSILRAFQEDRVGDGLAEFIANELQDTFDSDQPGEQQVIAAIHYMETASHQIDKVVDMLKHFQHIMYDD